jgi:hypothetical protein
MPVNGGDAVFVSAIDLYASSQFVESNEFGELNENEELFDTSRDFIPTPATTTTKTTKTTTSTTTTGTNSTTSTAAKTTTKTDSVIVAPSGPSSVTLYEVALFQLQVLADVSEMTRLSLATCFGLLEHVQWDRDRLIERLFVSDIADAAAVLATEAGVVLSTDPLSLESANAEFRAFESALADASLAVPVPAEASARNNSRYGTLGDVFRRVGYNFGERLCVELLEEFGNDSAAVAELLKNKQFGAIPLSVLDYVCTDNENFDQTAMTREHPNASYLRQYRDRLANVSEEEKLARAYRDAQMLHGHKVFAAAPPIASADTSLNSAGADDSLELSATLAAIASAMQELDDVHANDDNNDDADDGDAVARKAKAPPQVQTTHQSITVSAYGILPVDDDASGSCETAPLPTLPPDLPPREDDVECSICFSDVEYINSFALSCKHRFCLDCWSSHLSAHLSQGKVAAHCMYNGCRVALSPLDWRLLADSATFNRYRQLGLQNFVTRSPVAGFCSNPRGCARVIFWPRVAHATDSTVQCLCGWRFCWRCNEEAHAPASCAQMREFNSGSGEAATARWVQANTKPCPNCHKSIEKNAGCMHMHCSQCNYDFCWICLRKYENHANFYSCSFEPPKSAPVRDDAMANVLERFDFHKSAKEEVKARRLVCELVAYRLQRDSLPGGAIVDALQPIMNCHELLAWGEVYRMHVTNDVHALLLHELLHNLRIHTDQLWSRVLAATSMNARKKPVQVQATELHALHAIANVVERHRLALCEALDANAVFDGASSKFPKASAPVPAKAPPKAEKAKAPASAAAAAPVARPMVLLRRLREQDGFYRSTTDVAISAPIAPMTMAPDRMDFM